jgi:SAM-dependent methyltransferase
MSFTLIHNTSMPDMMPVVNESAASQAVMALNIETKFQFQTLDGDLYHEYRLPSNRDIQNCGGYIDKLLKYRNIEIQAFILSGKPSLARFRTSAWPVLYGRSPHIDLILNELIALQRSQHKERVSLLDHGCTVAEHYDLLDLLFQVSTNERAQDVLKYYGLDVSPLVLSAAKLFHQPYLCENFHLILAEGSELSFPDNSFDFSISVGVVNHVARPLETLDNLIRITRTGFVTALWVTGEQRGFWAFNHSGVGNYFFSVNDLAALARKYQKGRFYSAEFVPEHDSTQPSSYIGISEERLRRMGSYILVFSTLPQVPDALQPLDFEQCP